MNEALETIKNLIAEEQAKLDSGEQSEQEHADSVACLEHFNIVREALEAAQEAAGGDQDKSDIFADIITVGAMIGLLDDQEGLEAFKGTVLADA